MEVKYNKMRNRQNPMLVTFDKEEEKWNKCLVALNTEYDLTIKEMCNILKCSRSWANKYLKPHLHYIYISNGSGKSPDYLQIASSELEKQMTETTWYSRKEFEALIKNHITSITRQTKKIPIEKLIKPKYINDFKNEFPKIETLKELINNGDIKNYMKLVKLRDEVINKYGTEIGKKMWKDKPSEYCRTKTTTILCDLNPNDIDLNKLQAVHDLKNYGDTDEEIYRLLFKKGTYRLVLELPDIDGEVSQKVYYLEENDNLITQEEVLVKYKYISQ